MLAQSDGPGPSATCSKRAALGSGSSSLESMMADEKQEEWRPIPGYAGYDVSDHGRIRSWRLGGRRKRMASHPHMLRPNKTIHGYHKVALAAVGGFKHHFIHRLVLSTFVGPCPDGQETRHLNGDGEDNRLENLAWGTWEEQLSDQVRMGERLRGDECSWRRLSEADVKEIRATRGRISVREWGQRLGVNPGTVHLARVGQTWGHVIMDEEAKP